MLSVSESLLILGVRFDSKLTFEAHVRDVVSTAFRSVGIMRRSSKIFSNSNVLKRLFFVVCIAES